MDVPDLFLEDGLCFFRYLGKVKMSLRQKGVSKFFLFEAPSLCGEPTPAALRRQDALCNSGGSVIRQSYRPDAFSHAATEVSTARTVAEAAFFPFTISVRAVSSGSLAASSPVPPQAASGRSSAAVKERGMLFSWGTVQIKAAFS